MAKKKKFTLFNPEGKAWLTYEEVMEPTINITDKEDAKQYFEAYVAFLQAELDLHPEKEHSRSAEEIANHNIGYYAGYYGNEVRARVEELFECEHPVFGSIKEKGPVNPSEAFWIGYHMGGELNNKL